MASTGHLEYTFHPTHCVVTYRKWEEKTVHLCPGCQGKQYKTHLCQGCRNGLNHFAHKLRQKWKKRKKYMKQKKKEHKGTLAWICRRFTKDHFDPHL